MGSIMRPVLVKKRETSFPLSAKRAIVSAAARFGILRIFFIQFFSSEVALHEVTKWLYNCYSIKLHGVLIKMEKKHVCPGPKFQSTITPWKVIEPMDTQIKGFADSMYEQSFVESAVSTRADTTNLLKQRATRGTAKTPVRDSQINSIIKFQAQHIERCMAARLESYQRAYEEAGKTPTEQELEEILEDLKSVGDMQVKHSSSFIHNFLRARRAPVQCDREQSLMEGCAHAYDRVLQTWKTWREKVRIKEAAPAKIKAAAKPPAQTVFVTHPIQDEAVSMEKQRSNRTLLAYYWWFFKRLGNECHRTWRGESAAAALTAAGTYLLIQRVNTIRWTSLKSAGLSMVIAIVAIALWHILRTPWLLHKEASSAGSAMRKVHWGHGLFGMAVLAGVLGGCGWYARKQLAKPIAPVMAAPYVEPKNSLRKRTLGLANELNVFLGERWARRPPGHGPDTMRYDQATLDLYMKLYKNRMVGILQELQDKGLDAGLLAAPGGASSRFLLTDEIRQFRDLAYHLDEKGNAVKF